MSAPDIVFDLLPGFTVRPVDGPTFHAVFMSRRAEMFPESVVFDLNATLSEADKEARSRRAARHADDFRLRWLIEHNGTVIGWSWGYETEPELYYMCNTAIAKEHRGKGLYTALLPHILDHCKREGFQAVFSRHNATNNAVIVPKLKAGFLITGMELSDKHGTLVVLTKYLHQPREAVTRYRSGETRLPDNLKPLVT